MTQADESFVRLEQSAGRVDGLINEIAAASGDQAQGLDQISRAMYDMDKVTQQNAAGAEEMSVQAGHMMDTVLDLSGLVERRKRVASSEAGQRRLERCWPQVGAQALLPRPRRATPGLVPGQARQTVGAGADQDL